MVKNYYKNNYLMYINTTKDSDMSYQYKFIEEFINPGDTILDLGFGSGRDSLFFKQFMNVYSLDPVLEFCIHGEEIGLDNIYCLEVEDMTFTNMFNFIWACASLLHIPKERLNNVFKKCYEALLDKGYMYVSFKYGDFEGVREERYYTDLTLESLKNIIKDTGFEIVKHELTLDVRPNRDEKWLNVVLRKD